jgi:hypothetical protein
MAGMLTTNGWDTIVKRVQDGRCTPFLGAGASLPAERDPSRGLPDGETIAGRWIGEFQLEGMAQNRDLTQVAQRIGVLRDMMTPKDEMRRVVEGAPAPDFGSPDDPHGVLARLPFKVYLTTNYDDFLVRALQRESKEPRQEVCLWNSYLEEIQEEIQPKLPRGFKPTVDKPLVFHLHGHAGIPESMVLTEDDYLDFLVAMMREPKLLPAAVRLALMGSSLIFVGYRLSDLSFRVLFRSVLGSLPASVGRQHFSVQLQDDPLERRYLEHYFKKLQIEVYWGSATEFVTELQAKMARSGRA